MSTATELLVPKFLSQNEFNLICDVFNGISFSDAIPVRTELTANVHDAILSDNVHEKWNVDSDLLLSKLDDFGELNFMLVYAIMEFWNTFEQYSDAEIEPDHFAAKKSKTAE